MAPGSMPAGSRELLQEGIVIPPVRIVRDGRPVRGRASPCCSPTPARRPSARATCARSSRRTASPSGACSEVAERHGAGRVRAAFDGPLRLRRAPHPRGDRRDARRALRGGRGAGGRRRRRGEPLDPGGGDDRGRLHDGRFRRHRPHGPRQLQLPARRHPLGGLLRPALPHRPGHPGLGGRVRAGDGARARREPGGRPRARRGGGRQRGDLQPHRRRGLRRARARPSRCPRRGRAR